MNVIGSIIVIDHAENDGNGLQLCNGKAFYAERYSVGCCCFCGKPFNRYIYIDDAWFGGQAYWFSKLAEIYMLLLLPFMVLIAASFYTELIRKGNMLLKSIGILLILFQLFSAVAGFNEIFGRRENTTVVSAKTLTEFPGNNEKVLVPYRFVFNQLPKKNLVSYKTMEYHQVEHGRKFTKAEFLEQAGQLGIRHLVISPEMCSQNKMYPWMNEEFKDVGEKQFVKLRIGTTTHRLIRLE